MFKKTLLAATLAAITSSAMAVDVSGSTAQKYSNEGLVSGFVANDGVTLTLGDVILSTGILYNVGDLITINIAGAEFAPAASLAAYTLTAAAGTGGSNDFATGSIAKSATSVTFRVTTAGVIGNTLTLSGMKIILGSTSLTSKVSASAQATLSDGGTVIDNAGTKDTFVIGTVFQEHKFTVATAAADALDSDIDVAKARKKFATVNTTTTAVTDNVNLAYTTDIAGNIQASFIVDAATTAATVKGSFTGFESGVTGATNLGVIGLASNATLATAKTNAAAAGVTVAADLLSGAQTFTLAANTVVSFTPDAAATAVVLSTGAYTADITLKNAGGKSFSYNGLALGSFALNGASENFGYVPVNYDGAVTSQFEIGNKGSVDGEITLTAFDTAGNMYDEVLPFMAEAGKLTKISDADISTAFALTAGTKLKLTITVNSPDDNISMAGYSNRGTTGRMAISSTTN
jgi:hypothetical protein